MNRRRQAFCIHFAFTILVVALSLGVIWAVWYQRPGWQIRNAQFVASLTFFVALGLGPCLTYLISGERKAASAWRKDVSAIVVIQIAGFLVGLHFLWIGRPLFYVFAVDRIELVAAYEIDRGGVASDGNVFERGAFDGPGWVALSLQKVRRERSELLWEEVVGGRRVAAMARYFTGLDSERGAVFDAMDRTQRTFTRPDTIRFFEHALASANRAPNSVGAIPLYSAGGDWLMLFDKRSLKFIAAARLPR